MQERALRVRNTTNLFRNAGISWRQKLRLCVGLPAVSCLQAVVFDRRQYQIRYLQLCHCRPLCLTAVTIEYATCSCVTAGRCVWPQSLSNALPEVVSLQAVLFDRSHYRIRNLKLCHCRPFCLTAVTIEYATCSCVTAGRFVWPQVVSNTLFAVVSLQAVVLDYSHYRISYVPVRAYSLLYLTTHITNWTVTSHLWNATILPAILTLKLISVIYI